MGYRKALIIAVAFFLIFASVHVASFGPLENTHLKIRDFFFLLRGPVPPNPLVTIIAIVEIHGHVSNELATIIL